METNVGSGFSIEVVQSWKGQVLDTELVSLDRPRRVVVGEAGRFLFPLGESVQIVAVENGVATATLPARASALVSEGESSREIGADSAERSFVIGASTSLEIAIADMTFFVRPVQKESEKFAAPVVETSGWRWMALAAAVHAALLATFFFMPPDASALSSDLTGEQTRYIQVRLDAMQETPPPALPVPGGDATNGGTSSAPAPAEGGGAAPTPAVSGGPGTPHRHPVTVQGPLTAQDVQHLGVFDAMAQQLASLTGDDSPFDSGNPALTQGPGGPGSALIPGGPGDFGPGGLHITHGVGTCVGDHCMDGTIDQGGLDTHGGEHVGPGPDLTTHVPPTPAPQIRLVCSEGSTDPACITTGGLTREQIRQVISRHRPEVRFCYEQALIGHPELEGRVTASFQISQDGRVTSSSAAGMAGVDTCVAQATRRWTFPSSSSPTIVSYPFVLESSAGQ
jgi:hypothetical protein